MTARWSRDGDRAFRAHNGCRYCLSARAGDRDCDLATCKACGSVQCSSHGGARGTCGVCLVGILDGWSGHDRPCGYRGCPNRAVAEAPRVRNVCAEHALTARGPNEYGPEARKRTVAEYVQARLEERGRKWTLLDLGART